MDRANGVGGDRVRIEALLEQLSARTGQSAEAALAQLVGSLPDETAAARLDVRPALDPLDVRMKRVRDAQLRFASQPKPQGMSDDEWLYDDYGLPR